MRAARPTTAPACNWSGPASTAPVAVHPGLQVTVCLRKRFGRRFFDVRCATTTAGKGRRVVGQVSVPGCVPGVWRTTAVGEALNRKGEWVHQARSVSRRFRC